MSTCKWKPSPTLTVSETGSDAKFGSTKSPITSPITSLDPGGPTGGPADGRRRRSFIQFASDALHKNRRKSNQEIGQQLDEQDWDERALELIGKNSAAQYSENDVADVFDFEVPASQEQDNQAKLQHGIDLYEQGEVEESTKLFSQLADAVPIAQVLYGLALRHGWGCEKDPQKAFEMLEKAALHSVKDMEEFGLGGKAKGQVRVRGEMVLAMYELGNSFRNGWGCQRDEALAKTYYETAARLGDVDAMLATAQCYLLGVGTKKNKYLAATYYRFAEERGHIEVGNSWIWKPKYDAVKDSTT